MKILDDQNHLSKFNQSLVADSIGNLNQQIANAWHKASAVKIPFWHYHYDKIIFCGMGGSNLASELVQQVYSDQIKVPLILIRDYHLPAFADKKSLVIISSYSGNTEETINCLQEALKKKAKIICLSAGGKIEKMAKKHHLPCFKLENKDNPSNQPRYAVGSQLGVVLAIFAKLKIIKISNKDIDEISELLDQLEILFSPAVRIKNNPAKKIAEYLNDSLPIIVSADFLSANGHIIANQINESAKNLAIAYNLPELNHHLLEALDLPKEIGKKIKFIFFNCNIFSPAIAQRFAVTQKVLEKQKIDYVEYAIESKSKLLAAIEILAFGSWCSYYLAVINDQDPAKIEWVNFFKKQLKK